jgi:hypothetical protein
VGVKRIFLRKIGETNVATTLDTDDLRLGSDVIDEASRVAGVIGLVGELIAYTVQEAQIADAEYRHWRGRKSESFAGEKLAEHRIKSRVDGDELFLICKTRMARLDGDLEFLQAYREALRTKASMIRAKIDFHKINAEAGPVLGSTEDRGSDRETRSEDRSQSVREAIRRSRESRKE